MTERLGEKGILQPVRNYGSVQGDHDPPLAEVQWTHTFNSPSSSQCWPRLFSSSDSMRRVITWSGTKRLFSMYCFAISPTSIKDRKKTLSKKKLQKKKKKTYKLFSDSFAFFLISPWWRGEAERHNHSLETKGKIFHCSSRKNAGWHKHQPVYFFSWASG